MPMQAFTRNYEDNSTEAGFQFTFYCDICNDGYKTKFIESTTYKKGGLLRGLTGAVSIGASLVGAHRVANSLERGADILSERFEGMSPDWQREHDRAFELAQNEAKGHFHRCHKCHQWVCEADWNDEEGLCTECAPRAAVAMTSARANRLVEEIEEKAAASNYLKEEVTRKQTFCPECGKPVGETKFCTNCGANLALDACPKCGVSNQPGTRFCGGCGTRLE